MENSVTVIGGGPAGLVAAIQAKQSGAERVTIIEREEELGGILKQCIHNGFGLKLFKEDLTGPEYAERLIDEVNALGIEYMLDTMALHITEDKEVLATNKKLGLISIKSHSIVLAMGCRERPRGNLIIGGTRPAGIFTAGTAQRLINIEGYLPGKRVVILGSGDIGLIMARRLTLEGAEVLGVYEIMDHPGGLTRNIVQCLNDFSIPLYLKHTITEIYGNDRVEGIAIAEVDASLEPVRGTERFLPCDTLLLSVGLIPENELSKAFGVEISDLTKGPFVDETMETNIPNVYSCGNVSVVFDLADYVAETAMIAGKYASDLVDKPSENNLRIVGGENIGVFYPQRYSGRGDLVLFLRSKKWIESSATIVVEPLDMNFRVPYARPNEMTRIKIPLDKLKGISGDLRVSIKEV